MWLLLVQGSAFFHFSALLVSVPACLRDIFILLISASPGTQAGVIQHPFTSFGLSLYTGSQKSGSPRSLTERESTEMHTSIQAGEQGVCSVREQTERHQCVFSSSETHPKKKKTNPQESELSIEDIGLSELQLLVFNDIV